MLTEPINGYVTIARCNVDPTTKFAEKGKLLPTVPSRLTAGPYILPSIVLAVGCKVNKHGLEVGDLVYVNPNFCFQTFIEGRAVMSVHEDHLFQRLPRTEVERLGITAEDCRTPTASDLQVASHIPPKLVTPN